jgi:hypothetical protein
MVARKRGGAETAKMRRRQLDHGSVITSFVG